MKKFFTTFFIISLINLFNPMLFVYAKTTYKDVKNTNFEIIEIDKKYGLKDKSTNTDIFPVIYNEIKVLNHENIKVFYGDNDTYMSLYSPDRLLYSDFFKKYFDFVNKENNIKFVNYPSNGVMKYYNADMNGYGLIIVQDGVLHITKPIFRVIDFPDEYSMVFNVYNFSFAPLNTIFCKQSAGSRTINAQNILDNNWLKNDNPFIEKVNVEEDIEYKNNNIYVTYKDISVKADKIIKGSGSSNTVFIENINDGEKQKFQILKENIKKNDFDNIDELVDYIEKCGIIFKTKPKHLIQTKHNSQTKDSLLIYDNNQKYELIYDNYKLTGINQLISDMTRLYYLYFQEPDNIIVVSGSDLLIDKNGKIKIKEDSILKPLDYQYEQQIYFDNGKLIYDYKDTTKKPYYIMIKRNLGFRYIGIIDKNGNIIIPLTKISDKNNQVIEEFKHKISTKTKSDKNAYNRKRFWHNLPRNVMLIPVLPLAIIFPPFGFALFMGIEDGAL